jgi:hypothetical protein
MISIKDSIGFRDEYYRYDQIVKTMYKYYCNRSDKDYNLIIKELLEINLKNRVNKIIRCGFEIFSVYLVFENPKEFNNFIMALQSRLEMNNII